jgi:hypothetical protein
LFEAVIASFFAKQSEAISRFPFQDYEPNSFFLRQKIASAVALFRQEKIEFDFTMLFIAIGARHRIINCNSYI